MRQALRDKTREGFWEGKEPDFQTFPERRRMGLKQERVRKVRGKAVGCQDMCDGGCTRPGVRSPQVQCPPSRACQTRAGSPGLRAACRTRLGRSQRQQSGADSKGSQAPLMGCLSPWGLESHLRVSQSPQHSSQSGPPTLLQGLSRARIMWLALPSSKGPSVLPNWAPAGQITLVWRRPHGPHL